MIIHGWMKQIVINKIRKIFVAMGKLLKIA